MVTTSQTTPGALTFLPRPSNGGMHMAVLAGIMLALALMPTILALFFLRDYWYIFLVVALLDVALSWLIFRYYIYFPQMRYELAPDGLHLRYGPLLHYHIPYDSIQWVWVHHFEYRPYVRRVSSPGLQLYGALYHGVGKVFMCASANKGRVLLIKTDTKTYGITPQDEAGFLDALRAYTGERATYSPPE
ncbi:MAG TPA: PH domain-containing protein [Chloroflexia bacterium]|nr:PH domain-containing protein [Chloroflexia bacterium]